MKKIKFLAYAFAASVSLMACRDALDIVQPGEVTEEVAFQSVADLKSFLIGNVYPAIDPSNGIALTSYFTDETAITPTNPGWYFQEFRYGIMSDNGYASGIWSTNYTAINRVNRLIAAAELVNPGSDAAEYNSVLAEGRALRAYAYLDLLSYFTPNLKDNNALGVILSTSVPGVYDQLPRATNGEIYAQIEADLNYAMDNLLPPDTSDKDYYKFVTPQLINAIRARMYAYRGNYTLAKQYAQNVINASNALTLGRPYIPANFQNTPSSNPYKRMWQDIDQGEIIFAASRPSLGTGGIAGLWTTNTTNITGSVLMGMSFNLYNLINTGSDIRRHAFIDPTSTAAVKVIDKYPGKGNTALKNDIKIFRVSEMYLILAEAAAAENQLATAADLIKQVRDARRYPNPDTPLPVYGSKVDALRDVLKERRVELAFEGHRYIDLRRLGQEAGVSIDRHANDDYFNPNTPLTLPITDHRFTLPIPQAEILGNPSIQQNPGY